MKITTVLNGVDDSKLVYLSDDEITQKKKELQIPSDAFVFVVHSRICEQKNQLAIVEAVGKLTDEERRTFRIVCSGGKSGEYYEKSN